MIEKPDLEKVIDFCLEYNIPSIGHQILLYESIFDAHYENFSNKHVARQEIWGEFKSIYRAYWDKELIYELNKHKK